MTTRLHVGFVAPDRAAVDAFWHAGIDAGYADAGAPGPRPQYLDDYYGAFLLDPDGNSAEAVVHGRVSRGGSIDHVWFRVADRARSRAFYETVAPHTGFALVADLPDRTRYDGGPGQGSFTLVDGEPTTPFHLAFGTRDRAAVDAFHAAATATGHPDNGPPGERPVYHHGYYGAFVLDPDGNNVEVVDHGR